MECSLYLCRSLSGYFEDKTRNVTNELFINIFNQLPSIAVFDKTNEMTMKCSCQIVNECINVFGSFSRIINTDINLFTPLFNMLFNLLDEKVSQRTIAKNMYFILPYCSDLILSNDEIFNKILLLNNNMKVLSTTDQKSMILAFCRLINKASNENRLLLLEKFLSTPVMELQNNLKCDKIDPYLVGSSYIRIYVFNSYYYYFIEIIGRY